MWDKICDLFKESYHIEYMDKDGIMHKKSCSSKEYARGYTDALLKFEITDCVRFYDNERKQNY